MVNGDVNMDDLILEVFEEQEESFYFPLISQKTARAFVKAIHTKGMSFEDMGREIDEFEHNFSAWRKGLGRVGIGKRMLERLNRPLQELLDSDDEDEDTHINHILNKLNNKKSASGQPPLSAAAQERLAVPGMENGNHSDNSNSPKSNHTAPQNNGSLRPHQMDNDAAKDKSKDITQSWTKNIEDKMSRIEKDKENEPPRVELRSTSRENTPEERQREEANSVYERIMGKKANSEESETKSEETESKPSESSPSPEPEEEKEEEEEDIVDSAPSKVSDRVSSYLEKIHDDVPQKSDSTPPGSPQRMESKEETREERLARLQEKIANLKKKFPKQEESGAEEGEPKSGKSTPPVESLSSPTRKLSGSQSPKLDRRSSPLASRSSSRSDSPKISSPRISRSESPSGKLQVDNSGKSARLSFTNGDINEGYDSDLDMEGAGDEASFEVKNLVMKIRSFKHGAQDGQGFIYVFSDSPSNATEQRVKIGASRYPQAKLDQAKLFNPDLSMSSSVTVSKRQAALREVSNQLNEYKLSGSEDWYTGPMNAMLDTVMKVAESYTIDASQC